LRHISFIIIVRKLHSSQGVNGNSGFFTYSLTIKQHADTYHILAQYGITHLILLTYLIVIILVRRGVVIVLLLTLWPATREVIYPAV